jgi:hypothetical protein
LNPALAEKEENCGFNEGKIKKLQETFTKVMTTEKRLNVINSQQKATHIAKIQEKVEGVKLNKKELNF